MKRIYLIDCPGIVPPSRFDRDVDLVMRGVVRIENVENPAQYADEVLQRVQPRHLQRTYDLKGYKDANEFLEMLARKSGRLLKGGEPDVDGVAIMVINAYLRGKIPWFIPPPKHEDAGEEGIAGRDGRLGEMGRKRKREGGDDEEITAGASLEAVASGSDFEGFDDEDDGTESAVEDDGSEQAADEG